MYAVRTTEDYALLYVRLLNAIRQNQSVAVTYWETRKDPDNPKRRLKDQFELTIRIFSPYEMMRSAQGHFYVRSVDWLTGGYRSWRLDRIVFYTIHSRVPTSEMSVR
jgi:predicted DNA-binding transcriptional regulator YafY